VRPNTGRIPEIIEEVFKPGKNKESTQIDVESEYPGIVAAALWCLLSGWSERPITGPPQKISPSNFLSAQKTYLLPNYAKNGQRERKALFWR
jgi:hypothetical protein